ncbi:hypothetical protein SAMN05443428_10282 [Caloramator quimbayensis]|uniref:Uncharacterized protein n=1 Tax=Caloramator quimbayensis TaxID=1147123 RepID=A0A1T4WM27_9CLOT|nr:hypothetical protein [Caloramator quimbayensis]SKA77935.1 hypothetical protein SAMN05443428_10282 [Caloramator quimbayensis]
MSENKKNNKKIIISIIMIIIAILVIVLGSSMYDSAYEYYLTQDMHEGRQGMMISNLTKYAGFAIGAIGLVLFANQIIKKDNVNK